MKQTHLGNTFKTVFSTYLNNGFAVFGQRLTLTWPLLSAHVTKLLQSRSPWAICVEHKHSGKFISIIGETPSPVQVVDRTNAEALLYAQRFRGLKNQAADTYDLPIRSVKDDGASSNERTEYVGADDRPCVVFYVMCQRVAGDVRIVQSVFPSYKSIHV